ncbi:hypothetical protein QE152_g33317 [Popillia japonica]|uniref:Uncharacterized protein n=1 Tax=Popillia japonica TaxID=7064 RepID=A0AAW1IXV6_POPJA
MLYADDTTLTSQAACVDEVVCIDQAAQTAAKQYRDECRESFIKLKILTLPALFILECLLYIKASANRRRTHSNNHGYETRNRTELLPKFCRLSKTQRNAEYLAIKFYNKLPSEVKLLPAGRFRSHIKGFLVARAFYSCEEFLACEMVLKDFNL